MTNRCVVELLLTGSCWFPQFFFSLFDLKLFWFSFYVGYYVFVSVICVFSISQHDCSLIIRQCSNGIMWNFGKSCRCPWKVTETQTICSKWLIAVKSTKKSHIIRQIYSLDLANRKCAANDKLKSALSKLLTPLMKLHAFAMAQYNEKNGYRFLIAHHDSVLNYGNLCLRAFTNATVNHMHLISIAAILGTRSWTSLMHALFVAYRSRCQEEMNSNTHRERERTIHFAVPHGDCFFFIISDSWFYLTTDIFWFCILFTALHVFDS